MKKSSSCVYFIMCIIIFSIIISCAHPKSRSEMIFSYQELQDSVESYVLKTLPILDSSTTHRFFTTVIFRVSESDTLVIITPANAPFDCSPGKDTTLGANMLGGRLCEVVYSSYDIDYSVSQIDRIVNENVLTIFKQDYTPQTCSPKFEQSACSYSTIETAAQLKRIYILNRPEPLKLIR